MTAADLAMMFKRGASRVEVASHYGVTLEEVDAAIRDSLTLASSSNHRTQGCLCCFRQVRLRKDGTFVNHPAHSPTSELCQNSGRRP